MFPTLEERSVLVVDHTYKQTKLFIHLQLLLYPTNIWSSLQKCVFQYEQVIRMKENKDGMESNVRWEISKQQNATKMLRLRWNSDSGLSTDQTLKRSSVFIKKNMCQLFTRGKAFPRMYTLKNLHSLMMAFIELFLCARQGTECFTSIFSYNPHNDSMS